MNNVLEQDLNDISIRQNQKEINILFFSQKIIYSSAKTLKYIMWVLAIISLLSGIILGEYLIIKGIIGGSIFIFTCLLNNRINKKVSLAATTQELADRSLYDFSLDDLMVERIYEVARNSRDLDEERYNVIINNKGTDKPRGIKDWYDDISCDISKFDAILKCQKQNVYWDERLIEAYRKILYSCIVVLSILGIVMFWNKNINNIFFTIITGLPILKIIACEIYSSHKYINYSKEIDARIISIKEGDSINCRQLKGLQVKIYERRKSGFNVPDFFHDRYTDIIHKKFKNYNL